MALAEPVTTEGAAGLAAILTDPAHAVLGLDFDGTLSPIVADPDQARAHPRAVELLGRLAAHLGAVVVVTGRPAAVAVEYGGFAGAAGLDGLVVLGHYGFERWDAATGKVTAPEPHAGVRRARELLPALLAAAGARPGTAVEDKGGAVAVHVRRTADPETALAVLEAPVRELAEATGLHVEPGRMVLELRPPGMDKGAALTAFISERGARSVLFAGDDRGDLAAFAAIERLREHGVAGVKVCSGSAEVTELSERADLVVDGPDGVMALLESLAGELDARSPPSPVPRR